MIQVRHSADRGHAQHGWLDTYHTFSFDTYYDPAHEQFRALRVINEDRVAPGAGFPFHAHRDMEIITYVVEGHVLHRDSTGEQHMVGPNEIQVMSAGSGIVHSEFNASETELVRVLQIWIEPASEDLKPSYQQVAFAPGEKRGRFRLLAGPELSNGEETALINQDARLYAAEIRPKDTLTWTLRPLRHAWLQIVNGEISLNRQSLKEGDGAAVSGEQELFVSGSEPGGGEVLLFDLP